MPYTFRRLWSNVSSWAVDVLDFTDPPFGAEKSSTTVTYLIYNSRMEFAAELQASLRELLWLRRVRESSCRGAISDVRIILPKNSCGIVAHRLAALDAQLAVELYEHDPALNILEEIDPRRAGNRDTWLVPQREPETLLNQARPVLDPIISLAPGAVSRHPAAQSREL